MPLLRPDFVGARSICVCGHTGDGTDSQHAATAEGANDGGLYCTAEGCACTRFTWYQWTAAYKAYMEPIWLAQRNVSRKSLA